VFHVPERQTRRRAISENGREGEAQWLRCASDDLEFTYLNRADRGRPDPELSNIKQRGYVAILNRKVAATALGQEVHQVLSTKLPGLFETVFTTHMETTLDEIAAGKQNGRDYLRAFWMQVSPLFGERVITATLAQAASSPSAAEGDAPARRRTRRTRSRKAPTSPVGNSEYGGCPQCGEFLGCSGFPKCRFTRPLS
jgi:DNA topoisomerase-1